MYLVYKISIVCILFGCSSVWGFDPMAPPGYQYNTVKENAKVKNVKAPPTYTLRQIVIGKEHKSAVINGYVVAEGEYIKRALVKSISENKVILEVKNKQRTLYLKPNTVKVRH
ncbi:MAG: hypothetical protein ACJA0H_001054 [Francisellaceae bacterium]|jgi:hypothetical protein